MSIQIKEIRLAVNLFFLVWSHDFIRGCVCPSVCLLVGLSVRQFVKDTLMNLLRKLIWRSEPLFSLVCIRWNTGSFRRQTLKYILASVITKRGFTLAVDVMKNLSSGKLI